MFRSICLYSASARASGGLKCTLYETLYGGLTPVKTSWIQRRREMILYEFMLLVCIPRFTYIIATPFKHKNKVPTLYALSSGETKAIYLNRPSAVLWRLRNALKVAIPIFLVHSQII